MLFSLIHTETGSSSRFRHFAFEAHRLIQSLFGYFHHNPSLMEERSDAAICISILCHQRAHLFVVARIMVRLRERGFSSSRARLFVIASLRSDLPPSAPLSSQGPERRLCPPWNGWARQFAYL